MINFPATVVSVIDFSSRKFVKCTATIKNQRVLNHDLFQVCSQGHIENLHL